LTYKSNTGVTTSIPPVYDRGFGIRYIPSNQTGEKEVNTSAGISVSYEDKRIECVPPGASKIIAEYAINKSLYRDCDIIKYPTKK
jgi:hypothetical protein